MNVFVMLLLCRLCSGPGYQRKEQICPEKLWVDPSVLYQRRALQGKGETPKDSGNTIVVFVL